MLILGLGQKPMRAWFHLVARQRSSELFMLNLLLVTLGLAWLTEVAGLSLAQIGLGTAAQGGVMLFLELPGGGLADALGRKPVLILASLFSGKYEPMDVLKLKDIVSSLEGAIDAFEKIANTVEQIAVKES